VMPTLDLYRTLIVGKTRQRRSTHSAVCLVVSGEGRSTVGERTFDWSRHDVFTVPHWTWATHEPRGGPADLFIVTDRAIYERLELLRDEIQ
jgi:gentisate 1,2-dioxygenase